MILISSPGFESSETWVVGPGSDGGYGLKLVGKTWETGSSPVSPLFDGHEFGA